MKQAVYCVKYHYLAYYNSRNTTVCIDCKSTKQAQAIVKASGIDQELTIIKA